MSQSEHMDYIALHIMHIALEEDARTIDDTMRREKPEAEEAKYNLCVGWVKTLMMNQETSGTDEWMIQLYRFL